MLSLLHRQVNLKFNLVVSFWRTKKWGQRETGNHVPLKIIAPPTATPPPRIEVTGSNKKAGRKRGSVGREQQEQQPNQENPPSLTSYVLRAWGCDASTSRVSRSVSFSSL